MTQTTQVPSLVGSGTQPDEISSEALELLFEAFIRRTTSTTSRVGRMNWARTPALQSSRHLTGKSCLSAQQHNVLVSAINARLHELSLPGSAHVHRFATKSAG